MSKTKEAVQRYKNGYNCSQAILATYCEQLGLDRNTALKLTCPFGIGMAAMGETCGAVTGAFMLIGLKHGKYLQEDEEAKETTHRLIHEFTDKFTEIYGSIKCKDILSCDLNTEKGIAFAKDHGLLANLCPVFICDAARIIEELLDLETD